MDKEKMVKFTLELTKECTGSRKQADWQTTYSSQDWHPMDTAHENIHMAYGGMSQNQSPSHSSWMISQLSTWEKKTPTTSSTH
jgi:hypothetical protein